MDFINKQHPDMVEIKNELMEVTYRQWRKKNYQDNRGFFPIFEGFEKYFSLISPGAISLYVYFGMKSNTKTGVSFHSLNKIASEFDKTPRTISNWLQELVDIGLIYRKQKKLNTVSYTYLRPYE
ncbi:helix-turn-helix domain-containing protein [Leuconostoc mesenteroides]|uniref:helix-turn-helix domain-containing protein n=1 Tax=Leuconostoc mesenteroides TaxID=1245 RepID=UPI001CBC2EF4|nr:helix-turn-helix domain-containing protein [Leuconostoc mesenteroides]MBZ1541569.1 helix-turn-helix domain-containing protein [Leuconostoc mesenteroides]